MSPSFPQRTPTLVATAMLICPPAAFADNAKPYPLAKCFMSGHEFDSKSVEFDYQGQHIHLCCNDCKAEFDKDPAKAMAKLAEASKPYKNVNVEQFEKLRADKNNTVLDVRTKKEFDAGHIPGAINNEVNGPDFQEKTPTLAKRRPY